MSEDKKISSFDFDDMTQIQELLQSPTLSDEIKSARITAATEVEQEIIAANYNTGDIDPEIIIKTLADLQETIEEMDKLEKAIRAQYGEMGVMLFAWYANRHYIEDPNVMKFFPFVDRAYNAYKEKNHIADLPALKIEWEVYVEIIKAAALEAQKVQDEAAIEGAKIVLEDADINSEELLLSSIGGRRVKELDYMLDKFDSTIWNNLATEDSSGQLTFRLKAESNKNNKANKNINLIYSINFDSLEDISIVKRLTQYDKREYIAICGLYTAGNKVMSLSQIYRAMGYTGKPGKSDREKLYKGLSKFHAIITLDNTQEIQAGYNYPEYVYDGALLPFERIKKQDVINGQLLDFTIHVLREPPLLEFARGRKQITTIPLKLLQSPVSKTENNLAIEDYLIERIAKARTGSKPKRILLSTLYKNTGMTGGKTKKEIDRQEKRRNRAPETIRKYLDHYKSCGQIAGYKMDNTGITLEF